MSTSYFVIDSSSESSHKDAQCSKKIEKSVSNSKERSTKQKFESVQKLNDDLETFRPCKICKNTQVENFSQA
ncbi:10796_t:CDS:1, partial [Cetraspora pellucida]